MSASRNPERYVSPAQLADLLDLSIDEVMTLVAEGRLRGAQLGSPPQWRIAEASAVEYVDEQREESRRIALWNQSATASFPEIWGTPPDRRR